MAEEQAATAAVGQATAVQPDQKRQAVNLDELPEFRKYKSQQDKKETELQKQIQAQEERAARLEQQVESMITDPAQKAKLQQERTQLELDKYRAESRASKARRMFAERWGVPEETFELDDSPEAMTGKALDYQKAQIVKLQSGATTTEKEAELRKTEAEGGHIVSTAAGTPPVAGSDAELTKKLNDLRAIAQKPGSAAQRARVEILKLQRATPNVARSAKV